MPTLIVKLPGWVTLNAIIDSEASGENIYDALCDFVTTSPQLRSYIFKDSPYHKEITETSAYWLNSKELIPSRQCFTENPIKHGDVLEVEPAVVGG